MTKSWSIEGTPRFPVSFCDPKSARSQLDEFGRLGRELSESDSGMYAVMVGVPLYPQRARRGVAAAALASRTRSGPFRGCR
eukprot:2014638-Pyramimonas_sp.AAC.1